MIDSTLEQVLILELDNEEASCRFALALAGCLTKPAIIGLSGEIGSGKTTLVRALLKALGVTSPVKSPTFSLVETYAFPKESLVFPSEDDLVIHHFDLYRVHQDEELEYIGFRDYFAQACLCFIEWPEHAGKLLPAIDMRLYLTIKGTGREIQTTAFTSCGKKLLSCLKSNR